MPKKAIQVQADVRPAIDRIESFCIKENVSVLALAKVSGICQSSLARFLDGERKTVTPCARAVLQYIDNRHNRHSRDTIPMDVEEAIREVWDGDPQSVDFLTNLIRALKPVLDAAVLSQGTRNAGRVK